MKEQEFRQQYGQEQEALHAPRDLIRRTKTAAFGRKSNRIRRIAVLCVTAAAAVLLALLLIPQMNRTGENSQEGTRRHLGSGENGKDLFVEEKITVERKAVLPMEFSENSAWKEEIQGVPVRFAYAQGGLMAAYEEEKGYVIVGAQTTDVETMRDILTQILTD